MLDINLARGIAMEELEELVSKLDKWRKEKVSRGAKVPEQYKALATKLADKFGMGLVSKKTGLSSSQLRNYAANLVSVNSEVMEFSQLNISKLGAEICFGNSIVVRVSDIKSCVELLSLLGIERLSVC